MIRDRTSMLLLAAIAITVMLTVRRWTGVDAQVPPPLLPAPVPGDRAVPDPHTLAEFAASVIATDPFRLSNRPARVRLGETPPAPIARGPAYRPSLTLKAIIGGPPWTAHLAGIPGAPGVVALTNGDRRDSLQVLAIGPDSAVLRGPDTTWVLTIGRRP